MILINNHGLEYLHVNIKSQLKRSKEIAIGAMFAGTSFVGRGGQGLAKFQAQLSAITGQPLLSLLSKVVPKIHIKVPKIQNQNMMSLSDLAIDDLSNSNPTPSGLPKKVNRCIQNYDYMIDLSYRMYSRKTKKQKISGNVPFYKKMTTWLS